MLQGIAGRVVSAAAAARDFTSEVVSPAYVSGEEPPSARFGDAENAEVDGYRQIVRSLRATISEQDERIAGLTRQIESHSATNGHAAADGAACAADGRC